MRLLVSGPRDCTDCEHVEACLVKAVGDASDVVIIHGGCRTGVDDFAHSIAVKRGWTAEVYYADWSLGARAGPIRNRQMITEGRPDRAIVFLSPTSRGSRDCKNQISRAGIPVQVFPSSSPQKPASSSALHA